MSEVERCETCGQFVYRLTLWISNETIEINAGTRKAFVIDDITGWTVGDIPVMKLTEEVPAEVFTRHMCDSAFERLKEKRREDL
jgi:hypothetical protein